MQITAVTCVKNEGPFLLEWIAFNRVIGVTNFLFYSNDCTDATDRLLDRLAEEYVVKHRPNPAEGRNYQMEALKKSRRHGIVRDADWVWIADVDEFLNIHVGNHTIPDLIDACGDPMALSISFQFMANGGVETFEDEPVISQFCQTHNPDIWCDQTSLEVKTLVKKGFPLNYYGAHRPFHDIETPRAQQPKWTDGSGRPIPSQFRKRANKRRIRAFPVRGGRKFATLNHYALRSLDSYLVKNDRGDVNREYREYREYREFDDTYWRERNDASHYDASILRYMEPLQKEIAALKALPGVSDLHDEAVALHRQKRDELLQSETYQQMRETLLSANPYSPQEEAIRTEIGFA